MNKKEALGLLDEELERFRREPYEDLVRRIDQEPVTCERKGDSGATYQIEIWFMWDGGPAGDIRVMGSVDDGGLRAFIPVTQSFIVSM